MIIFYLCIGIIVGALICYTLLKKKLNNVQQLNEEVIEYNNNQLLIQKELDSKNHHLQQIINELDTEYKILQTKKDAIIDSIKDLEQQAQAGSEQIYRANYELMQEKLSQAADELSQAYQNAQEECQKQYLLLSEENSKEFSKKISQCRLELDIAKKELDEIHNKVIAAITIAKNEEDKRLEINKYKINISDQDINEINRLREIAPYFRNARAIYKIIWETYYRNNTTDLVNRVVGAGSHTGIYKITNTLNQKSYIGQAADIGARFKEHIKAGLGIDMPNNKLYTAMFINGVEFFTFEIVEECLRTELNEKEAYWIEFYKTQEYGYNMTKGNKS